MSNLELSNCKFNFQHVFYPNVVFLTKMICLNLLIEHISMKILFIDALLFVQCLFSVLLLVRCSH